MLNIHSANSGLRIVWWLAAGALLSACGERSTYPKDWPAPTRGFIGCPDLSGSYDGAQQGLTQLLAPGQSFGKRFYFEHSVKIERDPKDGHYTLTWARNERGLVAFQEWHRQYNMDSSADGGSVRMELHPDSDFRCSGGWLIATHWAAQVSERGAGKPVQAALAKDRAGNLIARMTTTLGWTLADLGRPDVSLGQHETTTWHHWLRRPPEADQALRDAGTVSLERYGWTNGQGSQVPVRLGNYMATTICVASPQNAEMVRA